MFLFGRMIYAVSYVFGSMINVSSTRSIGFTFVAVLSHLMVGEIVFGWTSYL